MIEPDINKRYCQSCGMPLRFDVEKYLGTNSDGSRSKRLRDSILSPFFHSYIFA
ncbi:zinc ribbon domain-containing protein, partial [Bacteroides xylanisolvens]|uniref:zinc ribbon domain-containing protein n=1 Tax=Bacteroides xylanisolvens TaxID=371601 RepID=UPI0021CE0A04